MDFLLALTITAGIVSMARAQEATNQAIDGHYPRGTILFRMASMVVFWFGTAYLLTQL